MADGGDTAPELTRFFVVSALIEGPRANQGLCFMTVSYSPRPHGPGFRDMVSHATANFKNIKLLSVVNQICG